MRAAVQRAHDVAVAEGFSYLERHAAFGRRGTDGVERVEGDGLIAAAFVHRTSRAGDPHLHTHVLVANLVHGGDGRWSALDARLPYAHTKTASFLYQATLRAELGVGWEPVRNGIAELSGVDERVRRAFSRRLALRLQCEGDRFAAEHGHAPTAGSSRVASVSDVEQLLEAREAVARAAPRHGIARARTPTPKSARPVSWASRIRASPRPRTPRPSRG